MREECTEEGAVVLNEGKNVLGRGAAVVLNEGKCTGRAAVVLNEGKMYWGQWY